MNVIVLISENLEPEVYSGFKKMCEMKGWSHNHLKMKKPPFKYKEVTIYKILVK